MRTKPFDDGTERSRADLPHSVLRHQATLPNRRKGSDLATGRAIHRRAATQSTFFFRSAMQCVRTAVAPLPPSPTGGVASAGGHGGKEEAPMVVVYKVTSSSLLDDDVESSQLVSDKSRS